MAGIASGTPRGPALGGLLCLGLAALGFLGRRSTHQTTPARGRWQQRAH